MSIDDFGDYDGEYDLSFSELWENCIWPTIMQSYLFAGWLLIYNTVFTTIVHFFCKTEKAYHIVSTITGLSYIYLCAFLYNGEAYQILPLVYISFILLHIFKQMNLNVGCCISAVMIQVLIAYEFLYVSHEAWLQIKSVVMIAMMKIMSLSFELKDRSKHIPSIWAYSGYIWCPSNLVLGPWITFKEYEERFHRRPKFSMQWFISIIKYSMLSIFFVTFSNCLVNFILPDATNRFIQSYRDAMSFRTSHYFISYLASAAMITGGFKSTKIDGLWSYTITNPLEIELPRSLVTVVIHWNIPMHTFLKKYIFVNFRQFGNFNAVVMTYIVSSMLHGLNVELSIVLLSLAFFSYIQFTFQDVLARLVDSCIRVRKCNTNCTHKNRFGIQNLLNFVFMFSTIVYLAYIGCLMANVNHSLAVYEALYNILLKWQHLHFYGHYLALFSFSTFIILRLLQNQRI